ncbi:hypothetical protein [Actinoplanes xinjiangensis]|uniref:hypothetical protein n=1 Tax=Actinoplanes xinjiangensis TaxID=512350 RepID=UPI0011B40FC6|nr:hypothetical protein [Actinoplanes xinjiangensis]
MSGEAFVSLADLRRALARSLDEVERQRGPVVDFGADSYWTVGPWDAFRFDTEVPQPTVGQLTDDVQSMQNMLADDADPSTAVWHDLAHLIGILNRLAALNQDS